MKNEELPHRAHKKVGYEEDNDDRYQRKLFFENEELGIIHIYSLWISNMIGDSVLPVVSAF